MKMLSCCVSFAILSVALSASVSADGKSGGELAGMPHKVMCIDAGVKTEAQLQQELIAKSKRKSGHQIVVTKLDDGKYIAGKYCAFVAQRSKQTGDNTQLVRSERHRRSHNLPSPTLLIPVGEAPATAPELPQIRR